MTARITPAPVRETRLDDARLTMATDAYAGTLFALVGGSFLLVTMLAASIAPGYDFHDGKISDLGVVGETAILFNVLLVAVGALNAIGGWSFYLDHRRRWLLGLYGVAGIGAVGAGVFPLNTGDLHSIFALLAFLFFNLEALGTARVLHGGMRLVSAAAGIVGLVFVVVMLVGDGGNAAVFGPIGHGGSERMIAYPAMIWLLLLGGYLIGRGRGSIDPLRPELRETPRTS